MGITKNTSSCTSIYDITILFTCTFNIRAIPFSFCTWTVNINENQSIGIVSWSLHWMNLTMNENFVYYVPSFSLYIQTQMTLCPHIICAYAIMHTVHVSCGVCTHVLDIWTRDRRIQVAMYVMPSAPCYHCCMLTIRLTPPFIVQFFHNSAQHYPNI